MPPDPLKARQMIMDSDLDGRTKTRALHALAAGSLDKADDPHFADALSARIIDSGGELPASEISKGVLRGQLTRRGQAEMLKLKEQMQGPYRNLIAAAHRTVDRAFGASLMAQGTPEQAEAKFRAKQDLCLRIAEGLDKGDVLEMLTPGGPKYALPEILQRNHLSGPEQKQAMLNFARRSLEHMPQPGPGQGPSGPGGPGVPQRLPGDSIDAYDRQYLAEYEGGADYV